MWTNKNLLLQQFIKNIIEKFVIIALLLKKSMILLKGAKCNFIEKKLLKLIPKYNNIKKLN